MMIDLLPDLGKTMMKSIEISLQIASQIKSDWSAPRDLTVSPLLC
jgi:hypothetical protein